MTQLALDGPIVHSTYYRRNVDQMPRLLEEGKEPMSVAHLMEQRIAVRSEGISYDQHDAWWRNYFHNADLWLRHPDKRGKVIPYSAQVLQFLQQRMKPETKLVDSAIPLPEGLYESMEGLELKPADIDRLDRQGYNPKEAKQSDVWRELSGRSQTRLDNYVNAVVAETGREQNLMEIYFGGVSKVPTGRLWLVYGRNYGSVADGFSNLISDGGRLVGVAPEAHVGKSRT